MVIRGHDVDRALVLLVEDDAAVRWSLREHLVRGGFDVIDCSSWDIAKASLGGRRPDVVLLDRLLGDADGVVLIAEIEALVPGTPVVMITGHGSVDVAVQAMREGAAHFLTKPIDPERLVTVLREAVGQPVSTSRVSSSRRRRPGARDPFTGSSPAMRTLRDEVSRVLENERPVLLLGETGTGKSMLARYIHDHGARRGHAFVDLNCATFSKELLDSEMFGYERGAFTGAHGSKVGLVEAANGGTLFLDEIGDMDPTIQPKLLKVLEDRRIRRLGDVRDREVDVRLISATHQSLETAVHNRTFRSDLYFRISAYPIYVPPLRARREDIRILASDLLGVLAGDLGRPPPRLTTHAVDALERHTWPGNVRELRNVLDRALLRAGDVVDVQALTFDRLREERGVQESGPPRTLREHEAVLIETALREEGGRVEAAARRLGMARSSLYQKLKVLGLGRTRR